MTSTWVRSPPSVDGDEQAPGTDARAVESSELADGAVLDGEPAVETASASGCLVRLAWLIGANLAMLAMAAVIARDGHGPISVASGIFWAIVAAGIGLRLLDIKKLGGQTASGQRATSNDFRRYALWNVLVAFGLWQVALWFG